MFRFKEIAELVVEQATTKFSQKFKLNKENFAVLKRYCDFFESFAEKHDASALDFEVDEERMTVILSAELPEFEIDGENDVFCELLKRSVSFNITQIDSSTLLVSVEYPTLWERKK